MTCVLTDVWHQRQVLDAALRAEADEPANLTAMVLVASLLLMRAVQLGSDSQQQTKATEGW